MSNFWDEHSSTSILCGDVSFNPFMPNGISHLYHLDEFIANFWVDGWYFSFLFKF